MARIESQETSLTTLTSQQFRIQKHKESAKAEVKSSPRHLIHISQEL